MAKATASSMVGLDEYRRHGSSPTMVSDFDNRSKTNKVSTQAKRGVEGHKFRLSDHGDLEMNGKSKSSLQSFTRKQSLDGKKEDQDNDDSCPKI